MVVWVVTCGIISMHHEASISHTVYTHVHDWFITHWAWSFASSFLTEVFQVLTMFLIFTWLALFQVSICIWDLLLLLGPTHATWTICSLLLRKLFLTESLVRASHLCLVIRSIILFRPGLVIIILKFNVCCCKTDECNFSLAIWILNLSSLASLELWILHLLWPRLIPLRTIT